MYHMYACYFMLYILTCLHHMYYVCAIHVYACCMYVLCVRIRDIVILCVHYVYCTCTLCCVYNAVL